MRPTALLPSEGRRAEDFFRPKIAIVSAGFEPTNLGTKGQQANPRSPKTYLFNLYINKIIQEYKTVIKKGTHLNNRKLVNTVLYVEGQILMATSENDLQTMAHHLKLILRKYK